MPESGRSFAGRCFTIVSSALLALPALVAVGPARAADARTAVPAAAAQASAEKRVRDLYAADFRDATPSGRRALAGGLLSAAARETDPADRFVLYRDGRDAAEEAGDLDAALAAVEGLASAYAIDGPDAKADALLKIAGRPGGFTPRAAVAGRALDLLAELTAAGRYPAADRVAAAAEEAAAASHEPSLLARAKARLADLRADRAAQAAADAAARKLKSDPKDPQSNLTVGAFDCFHRNDWGAGLPLLAAGADPVLRRLAERDLAGPADPRQQFDLAGAWWDAAEKQDGRARTGCRARAATWYAKAKPGLSGLTAELASRRISEAGTSAAAAPGDSNAGAIDLLALVELPRDVLRGDWKLQGGTLSVTHAADGHTPSDNLYFPFHPPEEYDYTLEFSLAGAGGDLVQCTSRRGAFFYVSFVPGSRTGFSLGGFNPPAPAPARPLRLEPGRRYVSRVEVRNDAVRLYVDGRLLQAFKRDPHDATTGRPPKSVDLARPGVAVIRNTLTVYRAQVVEVTGKGEVVKEDIKKTTAP